MVILDQYSLQTERSVRMARSILIIADYCNGVAVKDIQDKFECSRNTVLRLARAAGIQKRPKCFPEAVKKSCLAMLKAGYYLNEIRAKLGVSTGYISKLAKENGLSRYKKAN